MSDYESIPIDEVELDLDNPRIAKFVEHHDEITSELIYLALGAEGGGDAAQGGPTFTKLKESIRTCGKIIQPITVSRSDNGVLTCIDGNTRLALYREFRNDEAQGDWSHIPAIVHDTLSQERIEAIRLQAHLVGARPWDPYSKAKYLHSLRTNSNTPFTKLVDYCGGGLKEVEELINGYKDMEEHYRPLLNPGEPFDVRRFSGFKELQKPGIKEVIAATGYSLRDFAQWIHERRIGPLREVRALPRILRDQRARGVFLEQDAKAAIQVLEAPTLDQALEGAHLSDLCKAVMLAADRLTFEELRRFQNDPGAPDAYVIEEAAEALSVLAGQINQIGD